MRTTELKNLLDEYVERFNQQNFILNDPISIPHQFSRKEDIEISGFISAIFAWGQRKTIINKSTEFIRLMDNSPVHFVRHFRPHDLKPFVSFKHRTFNGDDALSVLYFLKDIYLNKESLEHFFINREAAPIKHGLIQLHAHFATLPTTLKRSLKHISTPERNSACKRLNMFLRWMIRKDDTGVDFGIWNNIDPSKLIIPLDVHVLRAAKELKLVGEEKANWKTAELLTKRLADFDKSDPVKYDFALFNYGLMRNFD